MSNCNCTGVSEENIIYFPSDFKLNVAMPVIDGYHMDDVDFTCYFYVSSTLVSNEKVVTLEKSQMIRVDADDYVAPLSSKSIGRGNLIVKYVAEIPDADFDGGYRKDIDIDYTEFVIK